MKRQTVELRIDKHTYDFLTGIVQSSVLGATLDDVVNHILRQALFEKLMRAAAIKLAAKQTEFPAPQGKGAGPRQRTR